MVNIFSTSSLAEEDVKTVIRDHTYEQGVRIPMVISPTMPYYYFEFGYSTEHPTGLTSDKPILVRRSHDSDVIQSLNSTDNDEYSLDTRLSLHSDLDLNGDGFKDLYLNIWGGRGGDYFLYNPKTGLFRFSGNFPELYIEPKTNRIYSQMHAASRIYYKTDNLRITESTRVEIEEMPNGKLSRVTKEKVKGKWNVTKREVIKDNEPEF